MQKDSCSRKRYISVDISCRVGNPFPKPSNPSLSLFSMKTYHIAKFSGKPWVSEIWECFSSSKSLATLGYIWSVASCSTFLNWSIKDKEEVCSGCLANDNSFLFFVMNSRSTQYENLMLFDDDDDDWDSEENWCDIHLNDI